MKIWQLSIFSDAYNTASFDLIVSVILKIYQKENIFNTVLTNIKVKENLRNNYFIIHHYELQKCKRLNKNCLTMINLVQEIYQQIYNRYTVSSQCLNILNTFLDDRNDSKLIF